MITGVILKTKVGGRLIQQKVNVTCPDRAEMIQPNLQGGEGEGKRRWKAEQVSWFHQFLIAGDGWGSIKRYNLKLT